MTYRFSQRSFDRLMTCHPDLVLLMSEALSDPDCPCDFAITSGHRGQDEQDAIFAAGNSKLPWPRSRHNALPSLAVDAVPYIPGRGLSWDWEHIEPLAAHVKATWQRLARAERTSGTFDMSWGGDWRWRDGAHYQLDRVGT